MQQNILLKSYDVKPFLNQDEYISFELYSNVKNLKENFLTNNFDLEVQYNVERNMSRKFFVYGKIYSKNVDVENLDLIFKTSNNDNLYSPNIKENLIGENNKIIKIKPSKLTEEESLSRNIFGTNVYSYFIQFEIEKDLNFSSNYLNVEIKGGKKVVNGELIYNNVSNFYEIPLVLYDDEGNFLPYGTEDTIFDENFDVVDININYPFLYNYHFIRTDFDVTDENSVYFPFTITNNADGIVNYITETSITDVNNFPKFNLLMDFPSIFGKEKVELKVKKITEVEKNQFTLPPNLYNPQLFFQNSPWKGFPANVSQFGVFGYAIQKLRNIMANNISYGVQNIYNTPQQFYDNVHRYVLSFFKGCNLDVRTNSTVTNDYFLNAFLSYNISPYKKDVDSTKIGEFIDIFREGGGTYFDTINVGFNKSEDRKLFEIDLTKTNFTKINEVIQVDITSTENVSKKFPDFLTIKVTAENKKPTVRFQQAFQSVEAFNQDIDVVVELDKKYNGLNTVVLTLSSITDFSTAVLSEDYEIIQKTAQIKNGDDKAVFKIRIFGKNNYFIPKELNLQLIQSGDELIIVEEENITTIDIVQSIITSWTKYEFPADPIAGIGIFRTNQPIYNSSEVLKFQVQNSNIDNFYKEKCFLTKFSYKLKCINKGDTTIYYDGEYDGGIPKEIKPDEEVFSIDVNDEFQNFEFILPGNKNIITFTDSNNKTRYKYLNSKYEFRLTNISPVVEGSSFDSDIYEDVIIDALELSSLNIMSSNETSEAFRTILRLNNFFQIGSVARKIAFSNIYNIIEKDLTQELSIPIKFILNRISNSPEGGTNADVPDFGSSFSDNIVGLIPLAALIRRNIYALRTRVNNIYYPRPKNTNYNSISTEINLDRLNNNDSELGIIKENTEMFGTVIINKSINNNNGTRVVYRKFTNRVDLINLAVPSQTTINYLLSENGSDLISLFNKYFKFEYRILRDSIRTIGVVEPIIFFTPGKINFVKGQNLKEKEENSLLIARNGVSAGTPQQKLPSPNFDNPFWIKYIQQGNPDFNPLTEIKFSPGTQTQINSFSDDIDGTKLLPVYYAPLYRFENQITF
jgi:hypothetical protein